MTQFSESLQFLLFRIIAIFMHVKQRKIMRHKQNHDFCKKQIILKVYLTLLKLFNQSCITHKRKRDRRK